MRTLQRRLSDMDTTFSAVIDTAQMRWAVQLLERDDYSLAEIAHQLGYTDQANFTRAFRRWTGLPPGVYRRSTMQTDDA